MGMLIPLFPLELVRNLMPLRMLLRPFWRRYLLVDRVLGIGLVCAPTLRLGLGLQDVWRVRWYVDVGGMAVGMDWA
jgi:hypothetical protein